MNVEKSIPELWSINSQCFYSLSLPRVNRSCTCIRNMHVKGPLLMIVSGTCEQDLQLASATTRVKGTIAHSYALKHVILCLSSYNNIPRQAIPYTMRCSQACHAHQAIVYTIPCPPGHTICHAMPTRPCHVLYQAPCLACQAITIYHVMPARPYHIHCDARQAILYHAMPAGPYHIPCQAH